MSGDAEQAPPSRLPRAGVDTDDDARAIVRLFQCSQCSYPLREPLTLPCGNTICRPCLPPLYKRENVTYPLVQGGSEAFLCPFENCGLEHSAGACSIDVTLNKILHLVKVLVSKHKAETSETPLLLEEQLNLAKVADSAIDVMPRSRVLQGGRIVATYTFADMGELNYHSGVAFTPVESGSDNAIRTIDVAVLENLREVVRSELECQVCYQVILDPLTTVCGHTFCRKCFARALDHAAQCPMCRRTIPLTSAAHAGPSNKRITFMIEHLLHDLWVVRMAQHEQEHFIDEEKELPLFPCTLAYPRMPTFLHIFEPRYRLMIRRVMDSGQRTFGMLAYKPQSLHRPGEPHYFPYGTALHIERIEMLPDGRSLLETRGVYRFRVVETGILDGYLTGNVQRIDDIPVHEEEALEARETSMPPQPDEGELGRIRRMSTQQLLQHGLNFVHEAQNQSAQWLHQRVLAAYGQPPRDPALFPYWLGSVLPIHEHEKYVLLPTTSVRERLQICAQWIARLEQARCEYEAKRAAQSAQREEAHVEEARQSQLREHQVPRTEGPETDLDQPGAGATAAYEAEAHENQSSTEDSQSQQRAT